MNHSRRYHARSKKHNFSRSFSPDSTRILVSLTILVLLAAGVLPSLSSSGSAQAGEPDLTSPFVSYRFVRNSQNIQDNELNALSDIYYYLGILNLTGELGSLTTQERQFFIDTLQSFQNADGGFGDWYRDRSKAGSTRMALEALAVLGEGPLNLTAAETFLGRLQVSGLAFGNFGFRSSVKETDADVSSSFDVVLALQRLGVAVPNLTGAIDYLKDHQNNDGGFGYQTNRESGVFWNSTAIHSYRGILALESLEEEPDFHQKAVTFLKSLQTSEGGFANRPGSTAQVSYTFDSVIAFQALGEEVPRAEDVESFILNNQLGNGGFLEHALDRKEGLHSSFWALQTLELLGVDYDGAKVAAFARDAIAQDIDGGFGDYPGLGSNVRFSFDAVSALNLIGKEAEDRDGVLNFITSLRNPDGGFGENNISSVETSYRALLTLQLLGEPAVEPQTMAAFIQGSQNNDGGFGFAQGYVSRGSYSYRALRILEILGYQPLNRQGALDYLRSLQNDDGGFGNYFGEGDSDISSSYRAVRGLAILGMTPVDVDGAENFFLGSLNPDGGFRRSPDDTFAPLNYSKSIYTYGGVLGLSYLGRPLQGAQRDQVYNFVLSLRNPDLGFANRPFFTSAVSSSFTSLWSYFQLYSEELNTAPSLVNATVSPEGGNSTQPFMFSLEYQDTQGQMPEYVHLLLGQRRYLMSPSPENRHNYSVTLQLSVGSHQYHFEAFDGLASNSTEGKTLQVSLEGEPPQVTLAKEPGEGTEDTLFRFTAHYSDLDGDAPLFMKLELDRTRVHEMEDQGDGVFVYETRLDPGQHSASVLASDGQNLVSSQEMNGPFVHAQSASRPDWVTFQKVQFLINGTHGLSIGYTDVALATLGGELVWEVDVGNEGVFVNYGGTALVGGASDEGDGNGAGIDQLMAFVLLGAVLGGILAVVLLIRKTSGRGKSSQEEESTGSGRVLDGP